MTVSWESMFIHVEIVTGHHDYCMIKLPESIAARSEHDCVSPFCTASICLPDEPVEHGEACWIAGWAGSSYTGAETRILQSAGVNVFSQEYCHWTSHYSSIQDTT